MVMGCGVFLSPDFDFDPPPSYDLKTIKYENLKRDSGWKGQIYTAIPSISMALVRPSPETIFLVGS